MPDVHVVPIDAEMTAALLAKARSFANTMEVSLAVGNYDGVGVGAANVVLFACDALSVARLGLRPRTHDEHDVLRWLTQADAPPALLNKVQGVLETTRKAEQEIRSTTRPEAESVAEQTRQVMEWVETQVAPIKGLRH
ncbi:MAG: HEPN domain-containing protein [Thermoplasmata archaeon]|jgi:HEPN domain-containing protein|nr:HEPN domain-containing protein [Thermoplasmata archaeon]